MPKGDVAKMGHVFVRAKFKGKSLLEVGSLGLKPTGRRMFKTIEGKLVEREIGEAPSNVKGRGPQP